MSYSPWKTPVGGAGGRGAGGCRIRPPEWESGLGLSQHLTVWPSLPLWPPPVSCRSGWLNRLAEGPGSSQVLCAPCWGFHVLCVPCWGSHVSVSYGDPKALGAFRVMQPACLSSALCGRPNSLARALPCSESPSAVFPETLLPCSPCPAQAHPRTLLTLGGQGPPTAPSSLGLDLFLLPGTQKLLHEETPKGSSRASLLEPPL